MNIWFLLSQKGGSGKTTLATNFSVCAAAKGKKVLLADLDVQQTAVKWWQSREDDNIQCVKVPSDIEKFNQLIKFAEEKGFDTLVVDTAGYDNKLHNAIIDQASLCIIPCQPSLADIRSIKSTISIVEEKRIPFVFVITRCSPVGREFDKTKEGLSAHGLVCPTPVIDRKAYKNAYAVGLGVTEFNGKDKAVKEIEAVYNWLKKSEKKLSVMEFV